MLPNRKKIYGSGLQSRLNNVRLFKNGSYRPYCSCSATTIFSHLLAVMTSLDYKNTSAKHPNSEVLRNRTKTSRGKRSGRKGGNCRPSKKMKSSVRNLIITMNSYHKADFQFYKQNGTPVNAPFFQDLVDEQEEMLQMEEEAGNISAPVSNFTCALRTFSWFSLNCPYSLGLRHFIRKWKVFFNSIKSRPSRSC